MTQNHRTENMLTVKEVARRLHIHPSTLRRWSNLGRIKAYRITPRGDRRYRLQDVAHFVAEMDSYRVKEQQRNQGL